MNDKEFWMIIRRALLMVVKAIDKKFTKQYLENEDDDELDSVSVTYAVDD